jgi:uncharacterized protein (DUF1800 family)
VSQTITSEPVVLPAVSPTVSPTAAPDTTANPVNLSQMTVATLIAASLAGCGGGGGDGAVTVTEPPVAGAPPPSPSAPPAGPPPVAPPASAPPSTTPPPASSGLAFPKAIDSNHAASFLQQAQFSSTQSEIAQVRATTFADWLSAQYNLPLSERGFDWMDKRGYYDHDTPTTFANSFYNTAYPVDFMLWKQLMSAPDAMRKRTALALSEFFVVSLTGTTYNWQCFGFARWWDMLCEQAFGNFRDLLEEVTLSPAMGIYLNTKGNKKENGTGRVPDENYSREVMQLFTLGLYQLNPDGTEKKDATGKSIDTYSQNDVTNLARMFTGYDFDVSDGVKFTVTRNDLTTFTVTSRDFTQKRMSFSATNHSTLESTFLGVTVPANTSGAIALKTALDTLFNHPNVGPFFSKQMIQRLVTSNPSPAYVKRVADAFNNNGKNVRGDLKAVWSAILLDDEARNPANAASNTFGKVREPMVRLIQWGRTFGVKSIADSWKITETSNNAVRLGQSPLRAPSVFNFFRPGFVPPNTALAVSKSVAPEFQLINETQVAGYLNYIQTMIRSGVTVRGPDLPQVTSDATLPLVNDVLAAYTSELSLVMDVAALVAHVNTVLCAGRISAANVKIMVDALNATALSATATDAQKLDRVAAAVYMAMACSEYLVQK